MTDKIRSMEAGAHVGGGCDEGRSGRRRVTSMKTGAQKKKQVSRKSDHNCPLLCYNYVGNCSVIKRKVQTG